MKFSTRLHGCKALTVVLCAVLSLALSLPAEAQAVVEEPPRRISGDAAQGPALIAAVAVLAVGGLVALFFMMRSDSRELRKWRRQMREEEAGHPVTQELSNRTSLFLDAVPPRSMRPTALEANDGDSFDIVGLRVGLAVQF